MQHQQHLKKRVLLWVESLQGGGHLQVADKLASALVKQGMDVHIVTSSAWRSPDLTYGGATLHTYDPRLQIDHVPEQGYVTKEGTPIKDARFWQLQRLEAFKSVISEVQPDAIITEHWPCSRGNLDFEVKEGIDWARARNPYLRIYGSARDVMLTHSISAGGSQPATADIVNRTFSKIFVHGDQSFIPFEQSFPGAEQFKDKLAYTGYLVHQMPPRDVAIPEAQRPVLVSSGGGKTAEGLSLYKTAIQARKYVPPETGLTDRPWVILVSNAYDQKDFEDLQQLAAREGGNIIVRRNLPSDEFRAATSNAAFCISLTGYNTAAEIYTAKVPAVMASHNGCEEQLFRARKFASLGPMEVLPPEHLEDPKKLAVLMNNAVSKTFTQLQEIRLEGEKVLALAVAEDLGTELPSKRRASGRSNTRIADSGTQHAAVLF